MGLVKREEKKGWYRLGYDVDEVLEHEFASLFMDEKGKYALAERIRRKVESLTQPVIHTL